MVFLGLVDRRSDVSCFQLGWSLDGLFTIPIDCTVFLGAGHRQIVWIVRRIAGLADRLLNGLLDRRLVQRACRDSSCFFSDATLTDRFLLVLYCDWASS